ncbi:sacsin N-terminal ATP-binding-like domain-containing protein [Rhodococcus artemisiae]|uniref:ATP-binding protein n=1 Tax=Rhodococcus artemisiae TaxID=714159 RepID=A0ABU7LG50_9NOCA|nr:ATP-binding protein [Rhodococcus artemisiae]MEE2060529.1 ATP-binding protein [Rhodococcus artemisiae]
MHVSDTADPFGTAALRDGLVAAWRSSPTRLREDVATEADLVRTGYRDRVLTELAQNAADAASRAGIPGTLRVWRVGTCLHIANTGAPLDETGVQALTALRASSKTGGVGRFGVGFTAVLAISDEVEVRSRTGSIRFSAAQTRNVLDEHGLAVPDGSVPTLRLAWPSTTPPSVGNDTEVVLDVRFGIDAETLLDDFRREAIDLLLELPALQTIVIDEDEFVRAERVLESGLRELRIGDHCWWEHRGPSARWLVPVLGGVVRPVGDDVLRAPTRSDEELSLPVLVVADVPMQPDRRRMLPGAPVEHLVQGYADFVAALPSDQRLALVPTPGFARSEVDGRIREALFEELRRNRWLPAADGGDDLAPDRAAALTGLDDALAEALDEVVPGLISPTLCSPRHAATLASVDVHRIGLARVADLLAGHSREPAWWHRLYEALTPLVVDAVTAEELAALPVPLSDGRTVTGPRTTVLHDLGSVALPWVRLVHPDAAHPLLTRLGAGSVTAEDLLGDPALAAAIDDVHHDPDDQAAEDLAAVVLTLVAKVPAAAVPRELGMLLLPDTGGELVPADELLLPGAPLAEVLVEDSPFGTVDTDLVEKYGADALRAIGVGWGFTVLRAELPTGPDHDLPDEDTWWQTVGTDPETLVAVRDLDLVDETRWDRALALLAVEPDTAATLTDRDGYTAWWLRNYAVLGDQPLGHLRYVDDVAFEGLLDPCTHPDAGAFRTCLAGTGIDDAHLAEILLDRLADPGRRPDPAAVVAAHTALARSYAAGTVDLDSVILPAGVRSLAGAVVDATDALVPDLPWFASVIPADRLVVVDHAAAAALAELLDIAAASAVIAGEPTGPGRATTWRREPDAVLASVTSGLPLPGQPLVVHEQLTVRCTGAITGDREVPWWIDASGTVHSTRLGLLDALAGLSRNS